MMDPYTASLALHMLAFRLGDETVAMDIHCVREVLDPGDITRIPQMPDYFLGVINLRGYAVPVIDLRHKLGMGRVVHTPSTRIVILDLPGAGELQLMGVLADSVRGVVEVATDKLLPPPSMGAAVPQPYLRGIVRSDNRFVLVLDHERLLTMDEITGMALSTPNLLDRR